MTGIVPEPIHTVTVSESDAATRLDVFLASQTDISRSQIRKLIDGGHVSLSSGAAPKPSYPVEPGDVITVVIPPSVEPQFRPEDIPIDIVYQDEHLIVVNKPPGMVVHPARGHMTGTLAAALLHRFGSLSEVGGVSRPGIVHRLDMNTSGLMIAALNDQSHRALATMIEQREVSRVYTAFVWGHPVPAEGVIDAPIGRDPKRPTLKAVVSDGRNAVTHYTLVAHYEFLSKLDVILETGRTHQIRVHLRHIGHHVFGDPEYGGREKRLTGISPEIRVSARRLLGLLDRQALHARKLAFPHPITGEPLEFTAALPDDLARIERELESGL